MSRCIPKARMANRDAPLERLSEGAKATEKEAQVQQKLTPFAEGAYPDSPFGPIA